MEMTPQAFKTKQSDDLDELIGWMESLTDPYDFQGEQLFRHIDQFQIVPLPEGGYECIVLWSELPLERQ
jgi:hypothetical protein